jgi:hypothetical protein
MRGRRAGHFATHWPHNESDELGRPRLRRSDLLPPRAALRHPVRRRPKQLSALSEPSVERVSLLPISLSAQARAITPFP